MREAYDLVKRHGAVHTAAMAVGLPPSTFAHRYRAAIHRLGLEPIHGPQGSTLQFQEKPQPPPSDEKPRVRVRSDGGEMRVLAIGDIHAGPGMPTEHLGWIAEHAVETKPTHVVQIGDFGDWASCSHHEGNETVKGRLKPSFTADEDAVHAAYEALWGRMTRAGLNASFLQTDGNHEYRVDRFVNAHPELQGDWDLRVRQIPARFNVERREYGEWLFLGGVGFIHHPVTVMGKPYGGKFPENQIANDAIYSIVWGHSHKSSVIHRAKIGQNRRVTVLNLGTAMPEGYTPAYAQWSTTGWGYGVFDLRISGGQITDHTYTSINELGRRYG